LPVELIAEEQGTAPCALHFRDKLTEAKGLGFDVKVLRKILALRKKSQADREEEEAILDVYLEALGMAGTPLGDYALAKEGELATV
jgi:uncharacterized protein (UPF0335 family)